MKSRAKVVFPILLLLAGIFSMAPITAHADKGFQQGESHSIQKHKGAEKSKRSHVQRRKGVEQSKKRHAQKHKNIERGEQRRIQRRKDLKKPEKRHVRKGKGIEKPKQRHTRNHKRMERGERRHVQWRGDVERPWKHRARKHRVIKNRPHARRYQKLVMRDRHRAYRWRRGGVVPYTRYFRGMRIVRPYGYRYPGYGFYYADDDAYRWLAFTAITLAILDNINEEQQRLHEEAQIRATVAAVDETIIWQDGNASGSVTTTRIGTSTSGRQCREFQQTITIGGKTEQAYGTACLQPDGAWEIVQ